MKISQAESCPETFKGWSDRAHNKCTRADQYHCVKDEFSRIVEVCVESIWIEQDESCQWSPASVTKFTTQTVQNTTAPTTSSNTAAIAGSVIGVLVVIVLSILGVVLWKKNGKKGFKTYLLGRGKTPDRREPENPQENEGLMENKLEYQPNDHDARILAVGMFNF
uniref:Uncharacterized protein LOC111108584 n=1 Tax=Crassostrea virginica TaxID=6565 RepID=A0A8B8BA30_CRAVI|nr:uncharacterized protein LOC111108584 [Crassostrea virginica]